MHSAFDKMYKSLPKKYKELKEEIALALGEIQAQARLSQGLKGRLLPFCESVFPHFEEGARVLANQAS